MIGKPGPAVANLYSMVIAIRRERDKALGSAFCWRLAAGALFVMLIIQGISK